MDSIKRFLLTADVISGSPLARRKKLAKILGVSKTQG